MGYYPDWLRIGSRSHLSHVEFYHIEDTNIVSPFSIWKTSSSPFPRFRQLEENVSCYGQFEAKGGMEESYTTGTHSLGG